jgi:hypothetical protein
MRAVEFGVYYAVAVRLGVFALVCARFVALVLGSTPRTLDLTGWPAHATLAAGAVLAGYVVVAMSGPLGAGPRVLGWVRARVGGAH